MRQGKGGGGWPCSLCRHSGCKLITPAGCNAVCRKTVKVHADRKHQAIISAVIACLLKSHDLARRATCSIIWLACHAVYHKTYS